MKINFTQDDELIDHAVKTARVYIENLTGLSLGTKKFETIYETYNTNFFELAYGPVVSVDSVEWLSGTTWVTLSAANLEYQVIQDRLQIFKTGLFRIKYTAGYSDIPEALDTDIKVVAAWMYANRGITMEGEKGGKGGSMSSVYPNWWLLNAEKYRRVVV